MATYDDFRGKFVSFDIETTGIDPGEYFGASVDGVSKKRDLRPRIWEAAFHDPKTNTIFQESFRAENIQQEATALGGIGFYDKNQAWQDHIKNSKSFNYTEKQVAEGISESFNKANLPGGMILIQNARFENRWMAHTANEGGHLSFFDRIRYEQNGGEDGNRKLYTPPSISALKSKIDRDTMSIGAVDAIYDDIIKQYAKETNEAVAGNKLIVGDLMDFTQAAFTKAVNHGLLDKTYLTKGQNIELLASVFLQEEEVHSAGSDARQQSSIFEKLMGLRNRIENKSLNEDDLRRLGQLNAAAPVVREESAARGALGFIESIELGKPNVSGPVIDYRQINVSDNLSTSEQGITVPIRQRISRREDIIPNYLYNTRQNQGTAAYEAIRELAERHGNENALRFLTTDEFKARIQTGLDESKAALGNIEQLEVKPATVFSEVDRGFNKVKEFAQNLSNGFAEEYTNARDNERILREILPERPRSGAAVALATATIGGLWAVSQFNGEEKAEEFRHKQRKKNVELYPEATFNMLQQNNRPELPYGYAKANWDNRIGHHEY